MQSTGICTSALLCVGSIKKRKKFARCVVPATLVVIPSRIEPISLVQKREQGRRNQERRVDRVIIYCRKRAGFRGSFRSLVSIERYVVGVGVWRGEQRRRIGRGKVLWWPAWGIREGERSMDRGVERLQEALSDVEYVAEQVLVIRQEMVECDKTRNSNREALTALRRQARTSRSSVPTPLKHKHALISLIEEPTTPPVEDETCLTCGDHDGTSLMWVMCRSADVFVRLPFHETHLYLEKEADQLERRSRSLQSTLKEKTMSLSQKGGLSDRIPSSLLSAFVNLKDSSS